LMQSMCAAIDSQGPPTELLSITNPYANYFCGVAPWHGYVQTWYDTTSKQTIDQLVAELKTSPPKWIIYQRNLFVMGTHETFFANGQPLPHRVLDKLIVDRIAQGQWKVVRYEAFRRAPWFVIQTRP
jgi:hypothetical protein